MTVPDVPKKAVPIDEIGPQVDTTTLPPPRYESRREKECIVSTSCKSSATKSGDTHKRRKRAKRKSRSERQESQEEDCELLLTQQSPSCDEEDQVATLLPLQRSHDQSCDSAAPADTQSRSASVTEEGVSQPSSTSRELLLNSQGHSVEEGGKAISQTSHLQDAGRPIVH